jgi:hypothetical protein
MIPQTLTASELVDEAVEHLGSLNGLAGIGGWSEPAPAQRVRVLSFADLIINVRRLNYEQAPAQGCHSASGLLFRTVGSHE